MKHSTIRFLAVLALAATVGCATRSPETAPPAKAAEAEAATAPGKPLTLAQEAREIINKLRNYSVHTYDDDVLKQVPPALEFVAQHEGIVSNRDVNVVAEVAYYAIRSATRGRDLDICRPTAERLLALEGAPYSWRIEAATYLAAPLAARGDFKAADALYAPFVALDPAKIPVNDWLNAVYRRADLFTQRNDMKGALDYITSMRANPPGNEGLKNLIRERLDGEAVSIYKAFHRYDEALEYSLAKGRRPAALALLTGGLIDDAPRTLKLAREILADDKEPLAARRSAWEWLLGRDDAMVDKYHTAMLGSSARETNAVCTVLRNRLMHATEHNVYGAATPAFFFDQPATIRVWELYLKTMRLAGQEPEFGPAQYGMLAYAGTGDMRAAVEAAKAGLANDQLKPEERYELALAARTLGLNGNPDTIAKAIAAADAELAGDLAGKDRLKAINRVGTAAVASRNENLARGFAQFSGTVKPVLPRKRYKVKFSPRPIAGAGDWENMPFRPEEQPFTRKYGGADLSFMLTDVATGDRGSAVKGGGRDTHPTTLQIAADEWGIHILYSFYDDRARSFEAGEISAGSYECYIAPGAGQPYTCFLCYPRKDALAYCYHTSYDSPGHRRVNDSHPAKFRSETRFTDDCVMNYVGFSWDNFATLIPTRDSVWDFESVFWGPVASAWNGTESIHGRSTWGELTFDISDADRIRILRAQLFKAVRSYKAEQSPNAPIADCVQGGVFDFWQDDALGDPVFYEQCLRPLEERLDAAAARVKVGMPDDEVVALAQDYLAQWRDIRFTVARLRADYLARSLTE